MSNYYNWGYSLHIGIDDYSNFRGISLDNLNKPVEDALKYKDYMSSISSGFFRDYKYHKVTLLNEQATLKNVIASIIDIAKKVESGDVVTITFSGHGMAFGKNNAWALQDFFLVDYELNILCKMFQNDVRVNIVSDCCQSTTMIDENPINYPFENYIKLIDRVKEVDEDFGIKLEQVIKYCSTKLLFCGMTHISAMSSDKIEINDSLTIRTFMQVYLEKYGSIIHNFEGFIYEIRTIAIQTYIEYPLIFRHLAFGLENDNTPFDPFKETDKKGMLQILPSMSQIGLHSSENKKKKAFHVY